MKIFGIVVTSVLLRAIAMLAALAAVAALSGCDKKKLIIVEVPNQLPIVRITSAPISPNQACDPDPVRSCYSLNLNWDGYDPDGRVDHYVYAVDPPSGAHPETTWVVSRSNEQRLLFSSKQEVPSTDPLKPRVARDFHVFVLKAVDNQGAAGPFTARAFFSYTQAPEVLIRTPRPSDILTPKLTPSVRITWTGNDFDGVFNSKPVKYKYILLSESSPFPVSRAVESGGGDSLRAFYAPTFAGWDSVGGDTTTIQLTNLVPDQHYVFVIVAFDEAGAYSPIFTLNSNMLHFVVGYGSSLGPTITAFNEFFNYTWRAGYCPCVSREAFIEVPSGDPETGRGKLVINWEAVPPIGANLRGFRWVLDIVNGDVTDETPRTDERTDLRHWSSLSLNTTSVSLGPFLGTPYPEPPEEHRLYIEAQDDVGLRSLAILRFQVIRPNFRPGTILVVRDTRFRSDNVPRGQNPNCPEPPKGRWPTTAEFDTFLFARGEAPWRPIRDPSQSCPDGYPPGTLSTRGLFDGYDFDTTGTRTGKTDLTVRLFKLSIYQHVVWIVDALGATSATDGNDPIMPPVALRYMSGRGRFNTLGAYIKMGGKVWMVGGGGAYATNIEWNLTDNDVNGIVFSALTQRKDLGPGRFMYDVAHWQSTIRVPKVPCVLNRYAGRFQRREHPDPGHYTRFMSELPPTLDIRTRQNTPDLPPLRTNPGDFYPPGKTVPVEYLSVENYIQENTSENPEHPDIQSTLDTLVSASGGGLPGPSENPSNVTMTFYHGPSVKQGFVFSGFPFWEFYRPHAQALTDYVLHRIWGLNRRPAIGLAARESAVRPALAPRPGGIRVGAHGAIGTPIRTRGEVGTPIRKPVRTSNGLRRPAASEARD